MHAFNFKTNCRPDHVCKFFRECWRKCFLLLLFFITSPFALTWHVNKQKLQFFFLFVIFAFQQWWNALVFLVFLERCIQILCKTGKRSYFLYFVVMQACHLSAPLVIAVQQICMVVMLVATWPPDFLTVVIPQQASRSCLNRKLPLRKHRPFAWLQYYFTLLFPFELLC